MTLWLMAFFTALMLAVPSPRARTLHRVGGMMMGMMGQSGGGTHRKGKMDPEKCQQMSQREEDWGIRSSHVGCAYTGPGGSPDS